MFEKNANSRHKNETPVLIRIAGEPPFTAFVFLKVGERLIDLLNDERKFIPIRRGDGTTLITAKSGIVSIIELTGAEGELRPREAQYDPLAAKLEPSQNAESPPPPPATETPEAEPPPEAAGQPEAPQSEEKQTESDARPEPEPEPERDAGADPRASRRGKRKRQFDPYEVLRISRDASAEEIRAAYKKRIKAVHPDSIAALDLDEDLARAANLSAQRVNRAYQMLMRDGREAKSADAA